jgi:hypothetical protein
MTATTTVKFSKPVREGAVGRICRYSKCGRFKIERREYELPYKSVGFVIYEVVATTSKRLVQVDTLIEAREFVNDFVLEG